MSWLLRATRRRLLSSSAHADCCTEYRKKPGHPNADQTLREVGNCLHSKWIRRAG